MGTILSNGTSVLRYGGKILRSPLKNVLVKPNNAAFYSVAGSYGKATASQVYLPTAGFHGPITQSDCYAVGHTCNTAYNNPTNKWQVWRETNPLLEPETLYYQGTYATTAPQNPSASVEAYGQLCAYRFKIPNGLSVTKAVLKYTLGGVVIGFGNASARSTNNTKGWNIGTKTVSEWQVQFGIIDQIAGRHPGYIAQNSVVKSVDILAQTTSSAGDARGMRDIWGKIWDIGITGRDGSIPTLTTPSAQSVSLTSSQMRAMNSLKEFWIVPYYIAEIYSSTNYGPLFVPPSNRVGYWGAASLWGLSLRLDLE